MTAGGPAAVGCRIADHLIVGGERPPVRDLARRLGVAIVERPHPPPAQPGLRSEYCQRPPRIILYRSTIDALDARLRRQERADMLERHLDDVHIAHELFHHFESAGSAGRLRPRQAEEAAHAFAQRLLDLHFHPGLLSAGLSG